MNKGFFSNLLGVASDNQIVLHRRLTREDEAAFLHRSFIVLGHGHV